MVLCLSMHGAFIVSLVYNGCQLVLSSSINFFFKLNSVANFGNFIFEYGLICVNYQCMISLFILTKLQCSCVRCLAVSDKNVELATLNMNFR